MAKPKKPVPVRGRARERGESAVITSEFDRKLLAALDAFVSAHKPKTTRRGILEWAVEEFLSRRDLWPPK